MATRDKTDPPEDLISSAELMRLLADEADQLHENDNDNDDEDTLGVEPMPKIMRMPEGIEVVERRVGRAVGQWILEVRCECGRRWFEVETVETGKCPRCGSLVLITIEGVGPSSGGASR
jgi:hypothetical protein